MAWRMLFAVVIVPNLRWLALLAPVWPLLVPAAHAGDVAVRYLVERTPLRAMAVAAPVTVELHADAQCSAAVASETVAAGTLGPIVDVQRVKVRGARSWPPTVEIHHLASGVPAIRTYYARLRGDGIAPVGSACQVQAFVPPPAVVRPIVRDAMGAPIGVLSVLSYPSTYQSAQTAVLRDDGHGLYALYIGSQIFVAMESGFGWSTADCSGTPYSGTDHGVFAPTTWDEANDVIYGPAGPAAMVPIRGFSDYYGCQETSEETALATPVAPLGLERFVPPFRIDHAPPQP